eukprot:2042752-Prymnesium_polylepis.1
MEPRRIALQSEPKSGVTSYRTPRSGCCGHRQLTGHRRIRSRNGQMPCPCAHSFPGTTAPQRQV